MPEWLLGILACFGMELLAGGVTGYFLSEALDRRARDSAWGPKEFRDPLPVPFLLGLLFGVLVGAVGGAIVVALSLLRG